MEKKTKKYPFLLLDFQKLGKYFFCLLPTFQIVERLSSVATIVPIFQLLDNLANLIIPTFEEKNESLSSSF